MDQIIRLNIYDYESSSRIFEIRVVISRNFRDKLSRDLHQPTFLRIFVKIFEIFVDNNFLYILLFEFFRFLSIKLRTKDLPNTGSLISQFDLVKPVFLIQKSARSH